MYMIFKRKVEERKFEAKRAEKYFPKYSNVKNRLGLPQHAPYEKVKFELNRHKNPRARKALGLTDEDFKEYGIEI